MSFCVSLLLRTIQEELSLADAPTERSLYTPDVGALVRDRGAHVANQAALLRRQVGFLNDAANCAAFVLPRHRRRLNRG
jgi:hypothetical protein